jgi:hypothetical protein
MSETSKTPTDTSRPLPRILGKERTPDADGEYVVSNGHTGPAVLTICVPCYRDDAVPLIARLAELSGAERCTLILYDDGSGDAALTDRHAEAVMAYPGPARLVTALDNYGRSHARNRLVARAEADWILLLDADMLPDDDRFLQNYMQVIDRGEAPGLIAGGFSVVQVTPKADQWLHYAQAEASDCLDAAARNLEPGRFVFTSNILVHRDVLSAVGFDESFSGWGWEDVDWGLRVAGRFPVAHIDNTATHLGLESDQRLLNKFGSSGANFGRLAEKHPDAVEHMALTRAALKLKGWRWIRPAVKTVALTRLFPIRLRLLALKTYRAASYSEYLQA